MPSKKKILFLDIDGVVNCKNTAQRHRGFIGIDPYMALLVNRIVEATGAEVVLSSTWRVTEDSREEVKAQVIDFADVTPPSTYNKRTEHYSKRGEEIQAWLDENGHKVGKYAILDDDTDMLPEQLPNYFQTTWEVGLTQEIADKVIEHLNK